MPALLEATCCKYIQCHQLMLASRPLRVLALFCRRDSAVRFFRNGSIAQRSIRPNGNLDDVNKHGTSTRGNGAPSSVNAQKSAQATSAPAVRLSLVEQLFPEEEAKRQRHVAGFDDQQLPRLPLENTEAPRQAKRKLDAISPTERAINGQVKGATVGVRLEKSMRDQGSVTSVLVLRNASKNLIEEDFRRLIPQGQHMEGWTLEQGDIVKIVPGRDMATLAPTGYYFLIFSSPLSAFTYQGHASRIHRMVATQSPTSLLSPIPPPPGLMIAGMDAHAAMESFTLVPPSQNLELRQLKPPLSPVVSSIIRNGGYARLVKRPGRMPYEARLTFEGPQLEIQAIRRVFNLSGRQRALAWGSGDSFAPRIAKWDSSDMGTAPSPMLNSAKTAKWVERRAESEIDIEDGAEISTASGESGNPQIPGNGAQQQVQRTAPAVYIVGFATESALQSFVRYWHRRTIETTETEESAKEGSDHAPVANVEVLW